jgi:hypothetical protein
MDVIDSFMVSLKTYLLSRGNKYLNKGVEIDLLYN